MSTPHYKCPEANKKELIKKDPATNKITISPCRLDIVWGGDPRYWSIPKPPFKPPPGDPIELLQVSWLEVTGSVPLSDLKETEEYSLTFKLSMKADAFGWADSPVYFMANPESGYIWRKADLSKYVRDGPNKPDARAPFYVPEPALTFKVPPNSAGGNLKFGMYEIWRGRWKGGLVIHEVVIKPVSK